MEEVSCNLCGSYRANLVYRRPDALFHPEEYFSVVECADCGLGFVNPRPSPGEMPRYYPIKFFEYFDELDQTPRYAVEANLVERFAPRIGTLLDVGCAKGDFPRFMRARGWSVEGVETATSIDVAYDFPVHRVPLPDVPREGDGFDAITAWAVLEHVHDPMAYFLKAARLLKPGGVFVFLVTNFRSLASRALFQEDVPRHLYFFSEGTVERYTSAAGLDLVESRYGSEIYAMNALNITKYWLVRLAGRALTWEDVPGSYRSYLVRNRLADTLRLRMLYALSNPLAVVDHLVMPLVNAAQVSRRTYGIVTFIARKPFGRDTSEPSP